MKKSLLELYALAICFISLTCFVVTLGYGIYAVLEVARPEFTMRGYEYERLSDASAYKTKHADDKVKRTDEELEKMRKTEWQSAINSESRGGAQTLVKSMIIVIIDMFVFFFHWRLAKKAREESVKAA